LATQRQMLKLCRRKFFHLYLWP